MIKCKILNQIIIKIKTFLSFLTQKLCIKNNIKWLINKIFNNLENNMRLNKILELIITFFKWEVIKEFRSSLKYKFILKQAK